MPVIDPIPPEKASGDLRETYDSLSKRAGRVPDFYGVMAHHPAALKSFLPLYASVMNEGTLERRYKELAYLKTSHLNGCEYCMRAHTPGAKRAGVTAEQIEALTFYERSPHFDEKDKAIGLLSRYYAKNPQRKAFISRDEAWYFKSLENEPRYKSLVGTQ